MNRIVTTRWKDNGDGKMVPDGQRTTQEVYQELRNHLESIGYLPDEYMLIGSDWRNGQPFPEDGYITQEVDFGSSEGIYLDAYINWYENDDKQQCKFFTGKTLGESTEDLKRMHLIAAAVTTAFQEEGMHARYFTNESPQQNGMTIHLNQDEIGIISDALLEKRMWLAGDTEKLQAVDAITRRLVGSITEYMQLVGEKPIIMSDLDTAELAIRENNLSAFQKTYPKVGQHWPNLFVQAASQPGRVTGIMTSELLKNAQNIPYDTYFEACKGAVATNDIRRVNELLEAAETHISPAEYSKHLFGHVVEYAYNHPNDDVRGRYIAYELLQNCSPEQIQSCPASLIASLIYSDDTHFALEMVRGGVDTSKQAGEILYAAAANRSRVWVAKDLVEAGMDVDSNNFAAMQMCYQLNNLNAAKVLVDCGADYSGFKAIMEKGYQNFANTEFLKSMDDYVQSLSVPENPETAAGQEQQM